MCYVGTPYRCAQPIQYDQPKRRSPSLWSAGQTPLGTFAERTALPGDLDGVLAALFARHGCAVWVPVHALAEGAVVLLPLLLVGPQLVVHPAAGLGAVH